MTLLGQRVGLGRSVPVGHGHTGLASRETSGRAGQYKYTVQGSRMH